ncbi:MAG: hypothetical protein L0G99_06140 [Propionibacteriales bacterium]|nr:hypothetical protein [Propionibacteriales bacterium]
MTTATDSVTRDLMRRPLPDRRSALAFAGAGLLFATYPLLRPWGDETTLQGARLLASTAWVLSHVAAMAAFVLLAYGIARRGSRSFRGSAGVAAVLGAALVLPYYGAEAFGGQAIAARAVAAGDPALLTIVDDFRYAVVPMIMFGAGLLALAGCGVSLASSVRRVDGVVSRLAVVLVAAGLIGYLPQFFATPGVRITHGIVLAIGCLLLARARTTAVH